MVFEFGLFFNSFKLTFYLQFTIRIFNPNTWRNKRCDYDADVVVKRHLVVRWLGALPGGFD